MVIRNSLWLCGAFVLATATSAPLRAESAKSAEISIRFEARIGDRALRCGESYADVGRTGASITLQDFRVYVSNLKLLGQDGKAYPLTLSDDGVFQSKDVALIDLENNSGNCNGNKETHSVVTGRAPAGDYTGLAFDLGVPTALNHQDPTLAPPPLNFSALAWPWRFGYKFTTIDLDTGSAKVTAMPGHAASGFSIHLGSVDCGEGSPRTPPTAPCSTPNRPTFRLETFDPGKDLVVLDLGALLQETDVTVNAADSVSGCMSSAEDDDCVGVMDGFGLTFRGKPSRGQRFVRVAKAP